MPDTVSDTHCQGIKLEKQEYCAFLNDRDTLRTCSIVLDRVSDIWSDRNINIFTHTRELCATILVSKSCLWSQNDDTIHFMHAQFDIENWN